MQLGAHLLRSGLFVAPMAGVTDRPFRALCRRFGARLEASGPANDENGTWEKLAA